ncbi:hypothetical protein ACWD7M_16615 [Streptomyces griseus]
MSRDRLAVQLSQLRNMSYLQALNAIKTEVERSGDKFSDAGRRLIAQAERSSAPSAEGGAATAASGP